MKKTLKALSLILALCMLLSVSGTAFAEEKTVLNFWHSMSGGTGKALDTMIEAFNASQNEIEVIGTYQGEYATALALTINAFSSGNAPDFLMGGSEDVTVLSTEEGVLANFYPFLTNDNSNLKLDDFYRGFIDCYYDEEAENIFALPMGCSTPVMYCNKTILEKAGLDIPTTWDEVREVSQKLVDGGYCTYGMALPFNQWFFWAFINSWGGRVFTEDGTKLQCVEDGSALASHTFLQDMVKDGLLYEGPQADSSSVCTAMFSAGECAFYVNSIAVLNACESGTADNGFETVVAAFPANVEQHVPSGGNSVVMLSSCKNPDAAWKFIEWLYTANEGIAYFDANSGYLACTKTIEQTPNIQNKIAGDENYKNAYGFLNIVCNDHLIVGQSSINNYVKTFLSATLLDFGDIPEALDELQASVIDVMAEFH